MQLISISTYYYLHKKIPHLFLILRVSSFYIFLFFHRFHMSAEEIGCNGDGTESVRTLPRFVS